MAVEPGLLELSSYGVKELLQLEARINAELRHRKLARTNNKALGDIAEKIVHAARGGVLEGNSTKSHDVTDPEGRRIQVKAISGWTLGVSRRFGQFRSFAFDSAVFLVFEAQTFELALARELTASEIEKVAYYSPHTNSRAPTLRQVLKAGADVTEEMRTAYAKLDEDTDRLALRDNEMRAENYEVPDRP